ncbi:hypothetical protein NC653_034530 [Populus alba x Populus x berolinensis]|uniref:Uncharacterized protein n=1 Tax=Populus alba x Populus x berolinensis TaxID=444605 RepID=A0AAD6LQM5_9ROSI|nr:hypothetical protein NC653_034530 [Populus alba x Populus x berolinensis]
MTSRALFVVLNFPQASSFIFFKGFDSADGKEILVIHIGGELFDTRWESYANPTENFLFFFNSLRSPFSIEFKVSIVISFQSELSKLHKKSDPRSPRLWLAMETLPLELVRTR